MSNMLLIADGYPKNIPIGEAAIDALLGFIVVFIGIALLVAIVWLVGLFMRKAMPKISNGTHDLKEKKRLKEASKNPPVSLETEPETKGGLSEEELSEETVAVVTAAIMAYYAKEKPKCEFTVKRIKRL